MNENVSVNVSPARSAARASPSLQGIFSNEAPLKSPQRRTRPLSAPLSRKAHEFTAVLTRRPDSPKSVISFEKYLPHVSEVHYECRAPVRMYCGGSPEVAQQALATQFARPLSRGSGACLFEKVTSREQAAKRCASAGVASQCTATQHAAPLHVRYSAVDPATNVRVWKQTTFTCEGEEGTGLNSSVGPRQRPAPLPCRRCPPPAVFVDPMLSFNNSKRSVSRSLSFSKSRRWKD